MTGSQTPKHLHYAWVMLLALMLMAGGSACLVMQASAGPLHWNGVLILATTLYVTLFWSLILLLWLVVAWNVFDRFPRWRKRTLATLLPTMVFFGSAVTMLIVAAPSPQRIFRRYFQAPLPAEATSIKIAGPTPANAGYINAAFTCSKQSTLNLINELRADPVGHYADAEFIFTSRIMGVAHDWSPKDWETSLCFVRTDRNGTGYILVTDAAMQRTLVARDPLWAKSEDELHEGASKKD